MADADELLNRALLEILRGARRGDVNITGVSLERDQHFTGCPDVEITSVRGEDGACGNRTRDVGLIHMTVGCPHQSGAPATLGEYGSLSSLLARMYRIGQDAINRDAYAEEDARHA
jgi:hypothetical protein